MKLPLRFTKGAEADLEAIGDFIAQDNPLLAIDFVARLRRRCMELSEFPQSAPLRPDIAADIRVAVLSRYLVLYAQRERRFPRDRTDRSRCPQIAGSALTAPQGAVR